MKKILMREVAYITVLVRYSDGRPAEMRYGYCSEEDFLSHYILNDEFRWIKAYEIFINGTRTHSWVRKRG